MLSTAKKSDAVIKLVDFGCAELIETTDKDKRRLSGGNTPAYNPPEAFVDNWRGPLDPSLDCWAMGVIIYIMLSKFE